LVVAVVGNIARLSIMRPSEEYTDGQEVLRVVGMVGAPVIDWALVNVTGPAELRHWRALAEGVAAFEQADIDTVFRRLAPQAVIAEHDAALAAAGAAAE
jgi:hypothetical protein